MARPAVRPCRSRKLPRNASSRTFASSLRSRSALPNPLRKSLWMCSSTKATPSGFLDAAKHLCQDGGPRHRDPRSWLAFNAVICLKTLWYPQKLSSKLPANDWFYSKRYHRIFNQKQYWLQVAKNRHFQETRPPKCLEKSTCNFPPEKWTEQGVHKADCSWAEWPKYRQAGNSRPVTMLLHARDSQDDHRRNWHVRDKKWGQPKTHSHPTVKTIRARCSGLPCH